MSGAVQINQIPEVKDILHDLNYGVFNHGAQKINESDTWIVIKL